MRAREVICYLLGVVLNGRWRGIELGNVNECVGHGSHLILPHF